jgi:hypothetical protein
MAINAAADANDRVCLSDESEAECHYMPYACN